MVMGNDGDCTVTAYFLSTCHHTGGHALRQPGKDNLQVLHPISGSQLFSRPDHASQPDKSMHALIVMPVPGHVLLAHVLSARAYLQGTGRIICTALHDGVSSQSSAGNTGCGRQLHNGLDRLTATKATAGMVLGPPDWLRMADNSKDQVFLMAVLHSVSQVQWRDGKCATAE